MLLGRVRAIEDKCNVTLTEITEMWVRALNMEPKGEMTAPLYKDRSAPWMHLEGELILSILEINEEAPPTCASGGSGEPYAWQRTQMM